MSSLYSMGQMAVSSLNPEVLVRKILLADGIETRNIKVTGAGDAIGYFENAGNTQLGVDEGIIMSTGYIQDASGNNDVDNNSGVHNTDGAEVLKPLASPKNARDGITLEFEFKPQTAYVIFDYVFGSEEYQEYVGSGFNDIFGFFISGPGIVGEQNVALIPGTNDEVSINNVNHLNNSNYYIDNPVGSPDLQMDGFTTVLQANLELIPCEWYTIKLAITDVNDNLRDSWVFFKANSFRHKTDIGKDTTYCLDEETITISSGYPTNYKVWNTGDTTEEITLDDYGTYWVDIYTQCGKFRDEIDIEPALDPISLGPDQEFCDTAITTLSTTNNTQYEEYLWSDNTIQEELSINQAGIYWLRVKQNGCFSADTVEIIVKESLKFDLGNDTSFCDEVYLKLEAPEQGLPNWNEGGNADSLIVTRPGTYVLQVFYNGCYSYDTLTVGLVPLPFVSLPNDFEICESNPIPLVSPIRDTLKYELQWSTGENTVAIQIDTSGTYTLNVRDKRCDEWVSDDIHIVKFNGGEDYYVPSAFTPNDDGINETFGPVQRFVDISYFHFEIYNRWGEKIFETSQPETKWNGFYKNLPVPSGVYYYSVEIITSCLGESEFRKTGQFHLIK